MSALHFPVRPSLEHARKAAKSLIRALRDRDPGAAARMRRSHPRCAGLDEAAIFDAGLKLADAQLVVAREAGAESWPRLVQAIASAGLDFRAAVDRAIEAAIDGHLDQARALLASRPEIAEADVHAASTFGQSEALGRLLAKDPSLATARGGPRGWEPLLYLALSRFLGRDAERSSGMRVAARMLLDAGADPNAYTVMGSPEFKQTPLYGAAGLAGDPELTRLLLEAGADPNDDTEFLGSESLYHASEHADTRCLQLLLEAGPDPDKVSYCLGRALDFENPRAVALYLRHGADPNFRNPFGRRETRLHKALIGGRSPEIIAMLLDAGADPALGTADGHGALALALRLGRSEAAELIRAKGGDLGRVSATDQFLAACALGDAPAVAAALAADPRRVERLDHRDRALLAAMAFEGRLPAVRTMLDAGFDPDTRGDFGTALNMAAWRGQAAVVRLLLERGADPAIRNDYGGSALGSALHGLTQAPGELGGRTAEGAALAPRQVDHVAVIDALLEAGADPTELPDPPTGNAALDALILRRREA
ncbi:MAG: ankyrin repeat domain-containing protein [Caldilineae bacterium]|nr:ankyrin repeat domain-containing protein [Chloroflexota bacterium]MCB9175884.1 ankyrin repeat domain-containing protein [Caldilineae bacterium]